MPAANELSRAILDCATDCIIIADDQGRITEYNPAAERTFGWKREEAIGRKLEDTIIPEQHREAHQTGMRRMVETGEARVLGKRIELEGLHRDGSTFPLELVLAEAWIEGEQRFIAYLRDLTGQRRIEAELSDSLALHEAFFQNAPIPMVLSDPTGRQVIVNAATAHYYDKEPEALQAAGPNALFAEWPDYRTDIMPLFAQMTATGKAAEVESRFRLPSGEIIPMAFSFFPIFGGDGRLAHIGSMARDLSEQRAAQAALARSADALHQSEKLAALGQLLAGVAHELNNPLAIVVGRAAMLQDKLAGTSHEASLGKLRAAADRCSRIVKTFLAMARQTGPRRSLVDVNDLVESALDMTAYGLRSAGVETVQRPGADLPLTNADGDQIVQVLINLIINAQHAMVERKGGRLTLSSWHDKRSGKLVIEVTDTGPGVPEAIAGRIFDPFFTTKDVGQGTGMGLAVSKGMIEAQDGTLELVRNTAEGATFRITVPVRSSEGDVVTGPAADMAAETVGRILIVDDEPEIAEMLAECLTAIGADCVIASDGRAALDLIGLSRFDAVFTDVRMPGVDGLALYATLKAKQPALARRLAFVSGDVLHRDPARNAAMEDRPFIEKPFDPEAVRAIARELLAAEDEE